MIQDVGIVSAEDEQELKFYHLSGNILRKRFASYFLFIDEYLA